MLNILVSIDQMINVVFLFGDPDETISSTLGKSQRGDYGTVIKTVLYPFRIMVDILLYPFDGWNHCEKRMEHYEGKNSILQKYFKRKL